MPMSKLKDIVSGFFCPAQKGGAQTTWVYCPKCKSDLCSTDSFISDTYDIHGDNHVLYKCTNCGTKSDWNFDVAPVPISWEVLNGN